MNGNDTVDYFKSFRNTTEHIKLIKTAELGVLYDVSSNITVTPKV